MYSKLITSFYLHHYYPNPSYTIHHLDYFNRLFFLLPQQCFFITYTFITQPPARSFKNVNQIVSLPYPKHSNGFPSHIKYSSNFKSQLISPFRIWFLACSIPSVLPSSCALNLLPSCFTFNMLMCSYFRVFALDIACSQNSLLSESSTACPSLYSGLYPNVTVSERSSLPTQSVENLMHWSVSSPLCCQFSFSLYFSLLNTLYFYVYHWSLLSVI